MPDPWSVAPRPTARLLVSLSTIAVLASCGGGGETGTGLSSYLPDFDAPDPVDIAVLTGEFILSPNWASTLTSLLGSAKYQDTPASLTWIRNNIDSGTPNTATNDPLRTSGAAFAHANNLTGDNQIIAFSDSHVSEDHEAIGDARLEVLSNDPTPDSEHGTSVVSVAMGNSTNFVGTAPGATGIFGHFGSDADLIEVGEAALAQGAVAWNNSWVISNFGLNNTGFNAVFGSASGQDYLTALRDFAAVGVVVFAVSNTDTGRAGLLDGLPVMQNVLEAGWIAVANGVPTLNGSGVVTSVYLLSSACYESARWCIVADGSWMAATGTGSDYEAATGSSFAAPQVSGALALLAEAFPTLTPHELRIRLLASAEDDFFSGEGTVELADGYFKRYSVLYGMGYLDIEAALRPIGPTAMTMADGGKVSTVAPVLKTGSGFGDAVERSLAGTDVAVKDVLNAPFRMRGGALTTGTEPGSQGTRLLVKSMAASLSAERLADPGRLNDPFASLVGPMLRLTDPDGGGSAAVLMPREGSDAMGVALSQSLGEGDTRLELGLKFARDDGEILSLGGDKAASMASVTLGLTQSLGESGFMALTGELGLTDLGGATELTGATTASFNAVKLSVGQGDLFAKGDRFAISLGLPVAISSGSTVARLPVLREGAAMSYEDITLDLSPEDRQIDLEMTYMAPLGKATEMQLSLIHSENFGNRAGERDTSGAVAFAFRF